MKALIVVPTYNERENIALLIERIFALAIDVRVVVADDNSPDGTANVVRSLQDKYPHLKLILRPKKMGLGRAYLDSFRQVLKDYDDVDAVFSMDADFSHKPEYVPEMLKTLEHCDLVIGSRYTAGGGLQNWPLFRILLSRFANAYAQLITMVPFTDLTSGFHCFRAKTLTRILEYPIAADGYAFLVELKYLACKEGFVVREFPIIFEDRRRGESKISKRVIFESMLVPWRCFFDRFFCFYRRSENEIKES